MTGSSREPTTLAHLAAVAVPVEALEPTPGCSEGARRVDLAQELLGEVGSGDLAIGITGERKRTTRSRWCR